MALAKLEIQPEVGKKIRARFNPERYKLEKTVKHADVQIPGLDWPAVQFVRGENERISFDLFFDTTEHGMVDGAKDVRELSGKVHALARVDGDRHAPVRCKLLWGASGKMFSFGTRKSPWCVLESLTEEFLLFSPSGVPLRAVQSVVFKSAWTIEEQLKETPRHTASRTRLRTLEPGQTLSHLAGELYGDPGAWRLIAERNGLDNPLEVAPGTVLTIPRVDAGEG